MQSQWLKDPDGTQGLSGNSQDTKKVQLPSQFLILLGLTSPGRKSCIK